jgi:hypothetical protein
MGVEYRFSEQSSMARICCAGAGISMKLWIVGNKILIDAPSTDDRLKGIPGYGWQPAARAWEIPNHEGVIALARQILGTDVSIPENLEKDAAIWAAKVEVLESPGSVPVRIERNRYIVDHGEDGKNLAELIPSCQVTPTGSEFLIHPVIHDLVSRLFNVTDSDALATTDPGDGHGDLPAPTNNTSTDYSDIGTDLDGPSVLLGEHDGSEAWIKQVVVILSKAATLGRRLSAREIEDAAADPVNASVLRLSCSISDQESEAYRQVSCCDLVCRLNWEERYGLLFELPDPLDYSSLEYVDDISLIKDCVAERIGVDKFKDPAKVTDILDVCGTDLAYRKAMDAYLTDLLFENPKINLLLDVKKLFLKRILDWFSSRIDENALDRAFDAYGTFLSEHSRPEYLGELVDVCSDVGNRKGLKSKSILLAAHSIHAMSLPDGGIAKAIEFLVAHQQSLPPDYDDRAFICSEARILAGENGNLVNLLGDCGHTEANPDPEEDPVRGSLLVIGGTSKTKQFGVRALESRFPNVNVSWLNVDEASADRVRTTIMNSDRKIVLYTWVMGHSIEGVARSAASSANAAWERVRLPAISDVIRVAAGLLKVGK